MNSHFYSSIRFLTTLLLFGGAALGDEKIPPPEAPFVVNAPKEAAWTIVNETRKSQEAAPKEGTQKQEGEKARYLKESRIEKREKSKWRLDRWSNGRTTEEWRFETLVVFQQPQLPPDNVIILSARSYANGNSSATSGDFPEFQWIGASSYKEVKDFLKIPCYYYEKQVFAPGGRSGSYTMKAWISVKEKLPVALDEGRGVLIYQFQPLSDPAPTMPAIFANKLQAYREAEQKELARHQMKF